MNRAWRLCAFVVLALTPCAIVARHIDSRARTEFREAVDRYQVFVVPHCDPGTVEAYVAARRERDDAFVRSLLHTPLAADYRHAIADNARRDQHMRYECMRPPPPPPPPGQARTQSDAEDKAEERRREHAEHFAGGDRQFAHMVALRDRMLKGRSSATAH